MRRGAHGGDAARIELHRRLGGNGLDRDLKPKLAGDAARLRGDPVFHAIDHRGVGIAQVHGEKDLAGHHIGRAGLHFENADGADRFRKLPRGPVDRLDHARGAEQRVMAARHRRRAGVGVLADDRHFVPAHGLHARDDADVLAVGLEVGTLLDVQLEKSR